jgi:RNA polymerase sigma-32 factor
MSTDLTTIYSTDLAQDSDQQFRSYCEKVKNIANLEPEEEQFLAKKLKEENDLNAAQKLVMSHLKLVIKVAMGFRGYGLPIRDIVSEGNIGLMHAVKKFDPDLGHRLSTYAMWWIKASIQEYVIKTYSLVKMGTTAAQKKLFFNLRKIQNKIESLESRKINNDDYKQIAHDLDVSVDDVKMMSIRMQSNDLSLNKHTGNDDESREFIEIIPDNTPNQEKTLANKQEKSLYKRMLHAALNKLNDREKHIISSRRLKETPDTLEILSQELGVSRERVRQIEEVAFKKLQNHMLLSAEHA